MMEQLGPVEVVFLLAGLASAGFWCWLATWPGGPAAALRYEPRRPVPWGLIAAWPAALMVVLAIAAVAAPPQATEAQAPATEAFLFNALGGSLIFLVMLALLAAAIKIGLAATREDFGLPRDVRQLLGDLRLGLLTALTCLAPVYLVQLALVKGLGWEPHHPTLEQLLNDPDWRVMAAAFFAAVIVAPLFEEFIFRLLLQGALERLETERLSGWETTPSDSETVLSAASSEGDSSGESRAGGELSSDASREVLWSPILASSLAFGLAHFTHGPAPISLIVFAVVLGYVYQRTHRITPCIIAHAAFNALSLVAVGLGSQ